MIEKGLYPRFLRSRIEEALTDSPVVLLHGPRQCGKTTLARLVGDGAGFTYFTFDDDLQRAAARTDPVGYVADLPERVVLDEAQRVPELFTSLKAAVDSRRQAGRFLLTGSANVLLVPKLADSLAGRMEILRLHPLAQAEVAGREVDFLDRLFSADFRVGRFGQRQGKALAQRMAAGGFPAALARAVPCRADAAPGIAIMPTPWFNATSVIWRGSAPWMPCRACWPWPPGTRPVC